MSSFTVLLLCIQACLIQNAFTQCIGNYAGDLSTLGYGSGLSSNYGYTGLQTPAAYNYASTNPTLAQSSYGYGSGFAAPYGFASYGGAGEGNVGVAGEMPVAGNTALAGQVPIIGSIGFNGAIPAGGAVSISGNCACGCNGYQYQY
ncbi:chorion class A protein Ld19 [Helicoverpa armigera]|uniref:chorion class A protein Ld19 n=1 Tax=Helicoverpa armigera TaxID=29058 RepID=UPI00308375DA